MPPEPDGAISSSDREQITYIYSGLIAGALLTILDDADPIIVTGTTTIDAEIGSSGNKYFIETVHWYNPSSLGDLLHLTDGSGRTIIQMRASINNDSQTWPVMAEYYGIRSDDFDSGTLYIYIR